MYSLIAGSNPASITFLQTIKQNNIMKVKLKNTGLFGALFPLVIAVALFIGYCRCIYKLVNCDFKPSYKAEVIYGIGACTGLGAFVGWMDLGE